MERVILFVLFCAGFAHQGLAQTPDFAAEVQPIFREHCYECHAGEVGEGGLRLNAKASAMQGGDSGQVIKSGDSAASLLMQLISTQDIDRRMPPEGHAALSDEQIARIQLWIDQGAEWPADADEADPRLERAQTHWAFQPLQDVSVPTRAANDHWSKTEIDLFIKKRLEASGLQPSDRADTETRLRRLTFDLTGLPPTLEQREQFLKAYRQHPERAWKALVDQLLESPHYGERWARHWLDVARYADSDGQEADKDRPHAYHYRDFVVEALNQDMPFDQFLRWQIAGDEFEQDNDAAIAATGFLAAGTSFQLKDSFLERERLFNRYNELDDIVSTVGTGLLGLTFGCARCHDHKYDAISAREYYQVLRVFHSGDRKTAELPSGKQAYVYQDFDTEPRTTWLFRRSDFYDREIEVDLAFPEILSNGRSGADYWKDAQSAVAVAKSTLQRRAFAVWLTDHAHGAGALAARVMVNRIWQHHFGHGLVRTSSDFGVRGDAPSHPQLLEYLTNDFVSHGWQLKRLHRKILLSAVWQQTSRRESANTEFETTDQPERPGAVANASDPASVDPQNRLLWKMHPLRLEAEALRDAMLSVSGTLNLEAGGPAFKPPIPAEANLARNIQGGGYPHDAKDDASTRRRSIYMFHKRLIPYPLFQAFDRPSLMVSCGRRQNTTVAPQAMAILNDRFVRNVAADFARRLIESTRPSRSDERSAETANASVAGELSQVGSKAGSAEDSMNMHDVVRSSFVLAFCRQPTAAELRTAVNFIQSQRQQRRERGDPEASLEALADYCHSLFGLNEFLYLD